jgi:hypothetical protein
VKKTHCLTVGQWFCSHRASVVRHQTRILCRMWRYSNKGKSKELWKVMIKRNGGSSFVMNEDISQRPSQDVICFLPEHLMIHQYPFFTASFAGYRMAHKAIRVQQQT